MQVFFKLKQNTGCNSCSGVGTCVIEICVYSTKPYTNTVSIQGILQVQMFLKLNNQFNDTVFRTGHWINKFSAVAWERSHLSEHKTALTL